MDSDSARKILAYHSESDSKFQIRAMKKSDMVQKKIDSDSANWYRQKAEVPIHEKELLRLEKTSRQFHTGRREKNFHGGLNVNLNADSEPRPGLCRNSSLCAAL